VIFIVRNVNKPIGFDEIKLDLETQALLDSKPNYAEQVSSVIRELDQIPNVVNWFFGKNSKI